VDIRPAVNREKLPSRQLDKYISEHGHPVFETPDAAFRARAATHPYTPEDRVRHHIDHLLKRTERGSWTFKHDPRISYYWHPRNLWGELAKVRVPTLIVRGGQSQVLPPEAAEEMRAGFPNAELVTIEAAGHTVPEDTPERFIEVVREFLDRHPA
jgi:pimeloyl-ACP methyl ester carboxylesterase